MEKKDPKDIKPRSYLPFTLWTLWSLVLEDAPSATAAEATASLQVQENSKVYKVRPRNHPRCNLKKDSFHLEKDDRKAL